MKITRKKITASTSSLRIPAPFNKYYDIASDAEINEYTGYTPEEGELSPCEDCEGYEVKHLSWVIAKPEYRDALANSGLDAVELVSEGDDTMLAYVVGDRIFALTDEDIADALGNIEAEDISLSTKVRGQRIQASAMVRIPDPFDQYYTVMPDKDYEELTGEPSRPSPCEKCEGYGAKHIYYLTAKPEYRQDLEDMGLAEVELIYEENVVPEVAYCVHDRIYLVDEADMPGKDESVESSKDVDVTCSDDDDMGREAFEDDPVAGIGAMFSISYDDAEKIFDWYDAEGSTQDFDNVSDFLDFINDDIADMLDAADDQEFANKIRKAIGLEPIDEEDIESCDQVSVNSAVDTGLQYWYYSRHGFGPGTIPRRVQIEDWYEEGYKTWMKLDKMLTTQELNDYDLKEQTPPEGVTTHNGDVIEACNSIKATECTKVNETEDSIDYVVSSTETDVKASEDFVIDTDLSYLDEPGYFEKEEKKRIERELNDEADAYDREHSEGDYAPIEGATAIALDNIDLDGLKEDLNEAVLDYMSKQGFLRPGQPKESKWDFYATDYYVVEVAREKLYGDDCIRCEVRAELSYDGMVDLADGYLDPTIRNYDSEAYFEQEDPGIAVAYLFGDREKSGPIEDSTDIKAADDAAAIDELREDYLDPDVDVDVTTDNADETVPEDIVINIPVDTVVMVEPDTTWKLEDPSFIEDYISDEIDKDKLAEDFEYVFAWAVPADEGRYNIKADVVLTYVANNALYDSYTYLLNPKESKAVATEVTPAGKLDDEVSEEVVIEESTNVKASSDWGIKDDKDVVEQFGKSIWDMTTQEIIENGLEDVWSRLLEEEADVNASTKVEAAMTEEELDTAIAEGKPFDLASFKKYKSTIADDILTADKVEVGDIIAITEDASETNLGTVVRILSVNDPDHIVDWEDYTFHVELLESPEKYWHNGLDPYRDSELQPGDEIDLHFSKDDPVGPLVLE